MILWKLKQVMTEYNITAEDLGKEMGLGRKAISNLRQPTMPEINHAKWDLLMLSLNKLKQKDAPIIKVTDLLQHGFTPEELEAIAEYGRLQAKDLDE